MNIRAEHELTKQHEFTKQIPVPTQARYARRTTPHTQARYARQIHNQEIQDGVGTYRSLTQILSSYYE